MNRPRPALRRFDEPSDRHLAVLIDADNAQATLIEALLAETSRYGTATVKRAYGDWTTPNLNGWRTILHEHAIQPVQQFRYTQRKNATDSALIIDAMDLLHTGDLDGFCLVSSDSDFTRLATRIRESGLVVYGFGQKNAQAAFVAACDRFIFTELLAQNGTCLDRPSEDTSSLKPLIRRAVAAATRDDGWALLSAVGSVIAKQHPSFDARSYGFQKLGDLFRELPYIETRDAASPNGAGSGHLEVRISESR
ncbi:MAG: NYN domain-containing protein [Pseudomonadales bacterium]